MELPTTVYIILKCDGDYEEHEEIPVQAFSRQDDAEQALQKLNLIATFARGVSTIPYETLKTVIAAEYKAIGYNGDRYTSWKLTQCPLSLVLPRRIARQFNSKRKNHFQEPGDGS